MTGVLSTGNFAFPAIFSFCRQRSPGLLPEDHTGQRKEHHTLYRENSLHRRQNLRCSLCGAEITEGEGYWYCNGASVCGACLPEFARQELAPFRRVRGREAAR